jgi:hypothetical protein
MTLMFLNGTAMAGQPDHESHAGSTFLGPARTAAAYRFYAIRDTFPGLYPTTAGGRVIEGELYDIPDDILRAKLLPAEPPELELGEVVLIDGERVRGMLLVPSRLDPADRIVDIAELGGFRAYQRFLSWNAKARSVLAGSPVAAAAAKP